MLYGGDPKDLPGMEYRSIADFQLVVCALIIGIIVIYFLDARNKKKK